MEDPDHVRDCTRRHFYEPMNKASKLLSPMGLVHQVQCSSHPSVPRYRYWTVSEKHGKVGDDEEDGESGIGLLGADQILAIIQHLPIQAVISFGMTCKRYKAIAETDALWLNICKREWGSRAVEAWPSAGRQKAGWKGLYRQMVVLGAAAWQRVQQGPVSPTPRASHTMNVVNGRITIFGGGCDGVPFLCEYGSLVLLQKPLSEEMAERWQPINFLVIYECGHLFAGRHLDDTWVAPVPEPICAPVQWQLVCSGLPSGRFQQSCTAVGDDLLLFGGINDKGTRLSDTYINSGGMVAGDGERPRSPWRLLDVSTAPPPRGAHAGCYAGDRKVVIFGGIASDATRLGDTWILDLAATPLCWQEVVTPTSPQPRAGHTLTWVGGKRMVLFGGRGANFEVMNDVWMLDLEEEYPSWVELQSSMLQPGHDHPGPRSGHSATLIFGGRVLIFGGEDSRRVRKGDVWVLDPSMALQAGSDKSSYQGQGGFSRSRSSGNSSSYRYSRRLWKRLKQSGRPPSKRSFHGACAVDSGKHVLIFGGMVDGEVNPATGAAGLGFDSELHILQLVP
ncbi:hypothetical protein AXG93_3846s1140 [Marchantia polymorpha subsp. ruderalis]|uniref:F-box domain-containing protein n=1 Tax=Marchantia polymorpha subsp. ruderalis TaxID=1480154 RepID=A0A176VM09_MARPO|nr:hypothetical protein AXG93_3846s1140 [Marchantia polymorpha subsp. ruderalis]